MAPGKRGAAPQRTPRPVLRLSSVAFKRSAGPSAGEADARLAALGQADAECRLVLQRPLAGIALTTGDPRRQEPALPAAPRAARNCADIAGEGPKARRTELFRDILTVWPQLPYGVRNSISLSISIHSYIPRHCFRHPSSISTLSPYRIPRPVATAGRRPSFAGFLPELNSFSRGNHPAPRLPGPLRSVTRGGCAGQPLHPRGCHTLSPHGRAPRPFPRSASALD